MLSYSIKMNVRKVDFKDVVRINMKDLYFQFFLFSSSSLERKHQKCQQEPLYLVSMFLSHHLSELQMTDRQGDD